MAKATRETKTVMQPVKVEVVNLELTMDEATMLIDVMGNISGAPGTRRRHADIVYSALREAGVPRGPKVDGWLQEDIKGTIIFS